MLLGFSWVCILDLFMASKTVDDIHEKQAAQRNKGNAVLASRMEKKLLKVYRTISAQYVAAIMKGKNGKPSNWEKKWSAAMYAAQIKEGMQAAVEGWTILGTQYGFKSFGDVVQTKAGEKEVVEELTQNSFFASPTPSRVDDYFKRTSKTQANTFAGKLDDIFEEVSKKKIDVGTAEEPLIVETGSVPAKLSRALKTEFASMSKNYANMISRTGVIWANNEGIMQRFISVGIKKKKWYATADERLCPWCNELHGKVVSTTKIFKKKGQVDKQKFKLQDGSTSTRTLSVVEDLLHPPRHPQCRCTLVADDIENQLEELLK